MTRFPIEDPAVSDAFAAFPETDRVALMELRELIFETAAETDGVGRLEETLKWGQPAYLTPETKSGSTLRLGKMKSGDVAVFAHCQTSIIADFRSLFPDDFNYEGNRAVCFSAGEAVPLEKLRLLIGSALNYRLRKRKR